GYDALINEDGKLLVRARYAVRNNQRSFLGVSLPSQAVLWSAALEGRPVRPGVGAGGSLLLPLRKGSTNEEAPTFVVELLYLQRGPEWSEKGDAHVDLPAVDLPGARTGLTLHHSARYDVDAKAGAFRVESDSGPWSAALRGQPIGEAESAPAPPPPPASPDALRSETRLIEPERDKDFKVLIDRFQKEAGRT